MKTAKKIFFFMTCLMMVANLYSLSDGAFNLTGAPGEGDCTGCHNSGPINSDSKGSIVIEVDSSQGFYEPGKTYPVKVTVAYPGKNRFGFALSTRNNGSSNFVGSFMSELNSGVFNRFEFVAHRRASIDAANQKSWSFRWKAPDTLTRDVTFYAAGVVSNGDNTNTGDLVYTTKLVLKRHFTGQAEVLKSVKHLNIYPLPAKDEIRFGISTPVSIIRLYNYNGDLVAEYGPTDFTQQNQECKFNLYPTIPAGIYVMYVKSEDGEYIEKVMKNGN